MLKEGKKTMTKSLVMDNTTAAYTVVISKAVTVLLSVFM